MKKFHSLNFGCRVNAAETNQWAQKMVDQGYVPSSTNPDIILVNTCAITKKGEYESVFAIKKLISENPHAKIFISGCADLSEFSEFPNVNIFSNPEKEKLLLDLDCAYTSKISDKFSHTHRFLLKVQSGCTAFCTYCTVPLKRPYTWSLPIKSAVKTIKSTIIDGYKEVIVTGVNLTQYTPGFSNLVEALLTQTDIPLISFGSIPLLCIDDKFISLLKKYPHRLSRFLHVPLQSGSNKILKLMNRPYNQQTILSTFSKLKNINNLAFGTDIIVSFPGETEDDFQETLSVCRQIGFQKIHTFRYSPRPGTKARELHQTLPKISKLESKRRSLLIRSLNV